MGLRRAIGERAAIAFTGPIAFRRGAFGCQGSIGYRAAPTF